jgi:hypothetical protein
MALGGNGFTSRTCLLTGDRVKSRDKTDVDERKRGIKTNVIETTLA